MCFYLKELMIRKICRSNIWCSAALIAISLVCLNHAQAQKPMNIIYILADDHRYDAMGFMNKIQGLQTPAMDRMAREGVHIKNAFVSTALCSPSRASILTGQYAHTHTVVDNDAPLPSNLIFSRNTFKKKDIKPLFLANGIWAIPTISLNPVLIIG